MISWRFERAPARTDQNGARMCGNAAGTVQRYGNQTVGLTAVASGFAWTWPAVHDGVMASNTALLVMDFQVGVVERFGAQSAGLLDAVSTATGAARAADVPVIYVRVGFRPGAPEISSRNRTFSAIAGSGRFSDSDPATRIHPAIAPHPEDVVVTKRRVSAFAGSDLDVVLRALEVDSLVLAGIATSGVILSTLRQAADLDYQLTVLRDACADSDAEVHHVLMDKVFSRQAMVVDTAEWVKQLATSGPG